MRKLVGLLAILALCLPLSAAERRILLIDDDRAGVFELESLVELCFPSDFRSDPATLRFYEAKELRQTANRLGAALDSAFESGDRKKVDEARQALDEAAKALDAALEALAEARDASCGGRGAPTADLETPGAGRGATTADLETFGGGRGASENAPGAQDAERPTPAGGRESPEDAPEGVPETPDAPGVGEAAGARTVLVKPSSALDPAWARRAFARNQVGEVADIVLAHGADMGILVTSEAARSLIRCRIFVFDGQRIDKVYDRISPETERDFDEAEAVFALMPYFYPPGSSLVVFDRAAPQFQTLRSAGAYAVARPGIYSYRDENEGRTAFLDVGPSSIVRLSYHHQSRTPSPLLATAFSNDVEIHANGRPLGKAPLLLDGLAAPFSLTAGMEGFKTLSVQSDKPVGELEISLLPGTLARKDLYTGARDRFYLSFARSLGIFGGKVLLASLARGSDAWRVLGLGLEGVLWISVVDLIRDLFDYYRTGTNISQQGGV